MGDAPHRPVMLAEALDALKVSAGGYWVDATLGRAGHAFAILERSAPDGRLLGLDQDDEAIQAAEIRLKPFKGRFDLFHANFSDLGQWVPPGSCDGVLMDLGVSSPQLDQAERGFSFQREGPLDMRMDRRQKVTAADVVNGTSEHELARIFWELGDERASRRIANAIVERRNAKRFESTTELAALIERVSPRGGRATHPATKVFQALRCHVNSEGPRLKAGLAAACDVLKPGGRLAVITFHSLEDRAVKDFGNERSRDYEFDGPVDVPALRRPKQPVLKWVQRKAIMPGSEETQSNPRARSAQLRIFERLG